MIACISYHTAKVWCVLLCLQLNLRYSSCHLEKKKGDLVSWPSEYLRELAILNSKGIQIFISIFESVHFI